MHTKYENNSASSPSQVIQDLLDQKMQHAWVDGLELSFEKAVVVTQADKSLTGTIVVPEGVACIGDGAFESCQQITEVILPTSIRRIGKRSFAECSSLKEVTIPDGSQTIGSYAFASCSALKHVSIPESVSDIGHMAFSECRALEEIVAPGVLDAYPDCCYCPADDIRRLTRFPTNRRFLYEDWEFTTPTALPKVRLNRDYKPTWKTALTLGFVSHPELYGSFDNDASAENRPGVSSYEEDMPYARYAKQKRASILRFAFEHDRPEFLKFYARSGNITNKNIAKSFLSPAHAAGAEACMRYLECWRDGKSENSCEVLPETAASDSPDHLSADDALNLWTYEVCYSPLPAAHPYIRLTGYKHDFEDRFTNKGAKVPFSVCGVSIPETIDGIPVRVLGKHVFRTAVFKENSHISNITSGSNIHRIECNINKKTGVCIFAPNGSAFQEYAKQQHLPFEECPDGLGPLTDSFWEGIDSASCSDAKEWSPAKKVMATQYRALPETVANALIEDEDIAVRVAVAKAEYDSCNVTQQLAADASEEVRLAVAANRAASAEALRILASDESIDVRCEVARRWDLPDEVQLMLAHDEYTSVREALSVRLSIGARRVLACDEERRVRLNAIWAREEDAGGPDDMALIRELAADEDWYIRSEVAKRREVPEDLMQALAADRSEWVRESVACNENASADVLDLLSMDKDVSVRCAVAARSDISEATLQILARDKNQKVRVAVASNADTPLEILEALMNDRTAKVVGVAAKALSARKENG